MQRTSDALTYDVATSTPSKRHAQPMTKPVPHTEAIVPPLTGPSAGIKDDTVERTLNVNAGAALTEYCWPLLLTPTVTAPGACSGAVQRTMVELTHVAGTCFAALPPKRHDNEDARAKFVPYTVSTVRPISGPLLGSTLPTAITASKTNCTPRLA
jgi:hypothetical protein